MRKLFLLICIVLGYVFVMVFVPAGNFPVDKKFIVKKGESELQVYTRLEDGGYIRSQFFAKVLSRMYAGNSMQVGEYSWGKGVSLLEILSSLRIKPKTIKVTIPEGFTKYQIADRLAAQLPNFDTTEFILRAQEGYLFPETYYFYSFTTTSEVLAEFDSEYKSQIQAAIKKGDIQREPTKEDIITASILEREARDYESMRMVAGIIKNRIEVGMPLQVDATVLYGMGTWKATTTYKDLENESAYNTYKVKGLPAGPISNPGIKSIKAAMNPRESDYVYYLTGRDGQMYYSKTLTEHNRKKALYLK
jgi:UPF0755 protein